MTMLFITIDILIAVGGLAVLYVIYVKITNRRKPMDRIRPSMEVFHDPSFKLKTNGQKILTEEKEKIHEAVPVAETEPLAQKEEERETPEELLKPKHNIPNSTEDLETVNGFGFTNHDDGSDMIRSRLKSKETNFQPQDLGVQAATPFEHGGLRMDNSSINYLNM